jgi:hypothetical protein
MNESQRWHKAGQWGLVTDTNGENAITTWAASPDEAWHQACEQAAVVGMLAQGQDPAGEH